VVESVGFPVTTTLALAAAHTITRSVIAPIVLVLCMCVWFWI
jgi:hypothetical protein